MFTVELDAHIDRALRRVRGRAGVSLAFGGPVRRAGVVALERFEGRTVGAMRGVELEPAHGLGGRVVALQRPIAVDDYFETDKITHHYDRIIRRERLRAMVAVPVIVARQPVAVLYGALHTAETIGDTVKDVVADEARALEQELVVRAAADPGERADPVHRERIRQVYAELRLAAGRTEGDLREAILAAARKLAELDDGQPADPVRPSLLTPREQDVLALVGQGMSNAQVGTLLGLTLSTTKSYVKTIMGKLGADNRLEAVVLARRAGLIP